jgi:hypothetical protein
VVKSLGRQVDTQQFWKTYNKLTGASSERSHTCTHARTTPTNGWCPWRAVLAALCPDVRQRFGPRLTPVHPAGRWARAPARGLRVADAPGDG